MVTPLPQPVAAQPFSGTISLLLRPSRQHAIYSTWLATSWDPRHRPFQEVARPMRSIISPHRSCSSPFLPEIDGFLCKAPVSKSSSVSSFMKGTTGPSGANLEGTLAANQYGHPSIISRGTGLFHHVPANCMQRPVSLFYFQESSIF